MNKFAMDYIAILENHANNNRRQIRKLTIIWIGVANRDYHYLSRFEIAGAKRIYQQLRVGAYLQLVARYRRRATHLQQTSKVC
jgi:hypothetical protein